MDSVIWLVIFLLLLAIEIVTLGLTTIWFAIGAIAAFVVTLCGLGTTVQLVVFIVVSIVSLILTRPIVVKYLNKDKIKTNVDELIGKNAIIVKDADGVNSFGEANLNGEIWMAKSFDGAYLKKDEIVEIVSVEGIKLVVKRKEDEK